MYLSCFSRFGQRLATGLSVRTLVGFQSFRFGPELFLHLGHAEGSLPHQMTWPPAGRNFDVFVAALALVLLMMPWPRHHAAAKAVVLAFSLLGLASLLNIGATSVRSIAHPIRPDWFAPGLEMAAQPPYILLPAFLVQSALCFHLVLLRRLTIMPEDMPREQIQRSMSGNEMW